MELERRSENIDKLICFLIVCTKKKIIGKIFFILLKLLSIEIPKEVQISSTVKFKHWSTGLVVHPDVIIEEDVEIYQGVTIGRADAYLERSQSQMEGIIIKKGAVLCAGAKILCKEGTLVVGENCVIGANSVLLNSTKPYEIWAGIPARKVGMR